MPYVDPNTIHNPAAGAVAPAAWGDVVRDDLQFLANPPKCRVFNSAAISIPNNAVTALTFDSERYDTDTMHSTVTNPDRITATTAGVYVVGGSVRFAASATGNRGLRIQVDGVTDLAGLLIPAAVGGDVTELTVSTTFAVAAGSYFRLLAFQTSGAALNVAAASALSPEFWAIWQGQ